MNIRKDNPNPKANIAILCSYTFFFYAFLSTYKELSKIANVEFVLDFTAKPEASEYPEEYKNFIRETVMNSGVFFRDIELGDLFPGEFFSKYVVLVGSNKFGYIGDPCNKQKRKVKVMYGLAKDSLAYGLYNAYFDLIVCSGPYASQRLSQFYSALVVEVGEPKLDGLYEEGFISKQSQGIILKLNKNRKTVLYMPTWGVMSSSKVTMQALLNLLPKYNILIKIHHMTKLFSPEEMSYLNNDRFTIIDESIPVTDALKMCDIVISDSSSSIFDAMVAKKSLVLIDIIRGNESFFTEAPFFVKQKNNDLGGVASFLGSLEQLVKKDSIAPVVVLENGQTYIDSKHLEDAILSSDNKEYFDAQHKLVSTTYSHVDGLAGYRTAKEIVKLITCENIRDKTLERYVDEYDREIRLEMADKYSNNSKKNQEVVSVIKGIKALPYKEKLDLLYRIFF